MGKVPTISINKTDGCHVYLSKNSLDCEIVSAKSSEMNVLIPSEGGDFVSAALGSLWGWGMQELRFEPCRCCFGIPLGLGFEPCRECWLQWGTVWRL